MAVRKSFGYDGGPTSPIVRHPFVGDPASAGFVSNPEPMTDRGRRRSQNTTEYQANFKNRKDQSHPAGPSAPVRKGPSHSAKGIPDFPRRLQLSDEIRQES